MTYGRQKVTCEISIVQKLRLVAAPNSRPTNTNISISEIPVMISGFIMGMFVTVSIVARRYLLRIRLMPTAAAVPMTVETTDALSARISVFRTAPSVSASFISSRYQLREKPEKTERLLASLNEKNSSIAIGANRKIIMRAVYTLDIFFMLHTSSVNVRALVGKALHQRHARKQDYHKNEGNGGGKVQIVCHILPLDSVAYEEELAVAKLLGNVEGAY